MATSLDNIISKASEAIAAAKPLHTKDLYASPLAEFPMLGAALAVTLLGGLYGYGPAAAALYETMRGRDHGLDATLTGIRSSLEQVKTQVPELIRENKSLVRAAQLDLINGKVATAEAVADLLAAKANNIALQNRAHLDLVKAEHQQERGVAADVDIAQKLATLVGGAAPGPVVSNS